LQTAGRPGKAWIAADGYSLGKIHNAAWRVSRRNPKGRCRKGGQGVAVVVLQQHCFCPFSFRRPWGFGAV
jgi:hypothetical protein